MSVKMETSVVRCEDCNSSYRLFGKSGTTISYIRYCPSCGSERIDVEGEVVNAFNDDWSYTGE